MISLLLRQTNSIYGRVDIPIDPENEKLTALRNNTTLKTILRLNEWFLLKVLRINFVNRSRFLKGQKDKHITISREIGGSSKRKILACRKSKSDRKDSNSQNETIKDETVGGGGNRTNHVIETLLMDYKTSLAINSSNELIPSMKSVEVMTRLAPASMQYNSKKRKYDDDADLCGNEMYCIVSTGMFIKQILKKLTEKVDGNGNNNDDGKLELFLCLTSSSRKLRPPRPEGVTYQNC
ncbi:hypothetical protein Glove_276g59 [Diversispora epigaea]|uniref:Uncharacterized protein n=1 Tax=Diversispora epigaea TaxID=1348612 RepID=A0A397I378_9GLOM|nr:hypothetical protein Glove_276g59 [Diversispora epigaea]